jgi:hypothetical protein
LRRVSRLTSGSSCCAAARRGSSASTGQQPWTTP